MYIDNIIRDIKDLAYDARQGSNSAFQYKMDAEKFDDLADACDGLDKASDKFTEIEEKLNKIIDMIEREALSAKVQSK